LIAEILIEVGAFLLDEHWCLLIDLLDLAEEKLLDNIYNIYNKNCPERV
jgi:hypothetical protein